MTAIQPSAPSVLYDLLEGIPADCTAIILPEQNVSVTYGALRGQVLSLADKLASAGRGP